MFCKLFKTFACLQAYRIQRIARACSIRHRCRINMMVGAAMMTTTTVPAAQVMQRSHPSDVVGVVFLFDVCLYFVRKVLRLHYMVLNCVIILFDWFDK